MSNPNISFDSPRLKPLKQNNLQYKPTQQQVLSYAQEVLQLNLMQDSDLIFLAEEALIAPLPQNWQACEYFPGENGYDQQNGNIAQEQTFLVYRNKLTKEVVYDHPLDSLYKQKARQLKLMKNTAKYSQNITPISQELIQSSVLFQKNNSKKGNTQSIENKSSSNDFSSNFEESKSKLFNQVNSKASDLVKNITQESMPYEDDEGEFSNLSMITDREQGESNYQNQQIKQVKENNMNIKKGKIDIRGQSVGQKEKKKIDINKLKEKPQVIRPIIISSQKDIKKQKQKQAQMKQAIQLRMREAITKTVLQKLNQIHKQKMAKLNHTVKQSITLKEVQEKIMIARQFPESQSSQVKSGVNVIHKKLQQLKIIERQNKAMDQKIQELLKIIEFQTML